MEAIAEDLAEKLANLCAKLADELAKLCEKFEADGLSREDVISELEMQTFELRESNKTQRTLHPLP